MKSLLTAAAAAILLSSGIAQASTLLFSQTVVPASTSGDTTFLDDADDFAVSFDFSSVAYDSIDRFELTLMASGASNEVFQICTNRCRTLFTESWSIRVQGSSNGAADDLFASVLDGVNSYTISAAADAGARDAFAHSAATGLFTVWMSESSPDGVIRNPRITVSSLSLSVFGTATATPSPVPLPAGLLLLVMGLGGLAALRLRRRPAA